MSSLALRSRSGGFPAALVAAVVSIVVIGVETAIAWFFLSHRETDAVMLYLLGVVLVAMRYGYMASLLTAAGSVAAFDYFFTAPYFSFAVADERELVTFAIMLFVAFVISDRTERIRRAAAAAREREARTAALYAMSRELAVARSSDEVVRVAHRHLQSVFHSDVSLLVPDAGGVLRRPVSEVDPSVGAARLVTLHATTGTLGVLVARSASPASRVRPAQAELLDTFASQIALALERARFGEDVQRAQLEVQNERLRNALLSSVSHDLRTPLAVIKGAVTALIDGVPNLPLPRLGEYLTTISDEASRLNRLVRNLLDMTSLEAGALRVRNKQWQPLEEVIGVALNRLEEQLEDRAVKVRIEPEASLAPFDATLIEQVFVNLVENALKYTPAGTPMSITVRKADEQVEVVVADSGPGVPVGEEEAIFEKFHRAARTGPGMGIGLTICRGIVTAHGGKIWYERGQEGGASFRFTLPLDVAGRSTTVLPEAVGDP